MVFIFLLLNAQIWLNIFKLTWCLGVLKSEPDRPAGDMEVEKPSENDENEEREDRDDSDDEFKIAQDIKKKSRHLNRPTFFLDSAGQVNMK